MARHVFWVSPNTNGWHVKHQGSGETYKFITKQQAIEFARRWANNNQPSQVKVQLLSGQIETEWTYGNDPRKYPG